MDGLVKNFQEHRKRHGNTAEMPERFIWHAFAGLCDGLAYLMGGRSYSSNDVTSYEPEPGWTPVLHRDVKTENILLRSRSTVGTKRYFYCILSDFGLACDDYPKGHPKENWHQKAGGKLGTADFLAPELCWNPYPSNIQETKRFPPGQKHTAKSDLWALAAIMHNLASCEQMSHIDWQSRPEDMGWEVPEKTEWTVWYEGVQSRKQLDISTIRRKTPFTSALTDSIKVAGRFDPKKRLNPITMMEFLKKQIVKTEFTSHPPKGHDHEALPDWATNVHDYHSRPAMDPKQFPAG